MPLAEDIEQSDGVGQALADVFAVLDSAGIPYCVLHGYETYPQQIGSDVDLVVDSKIAPGRLYDLFQRNLPGVDIVHCRGYGTVIAVRDSRGLPSFLTLDMSVDSRIHGFPLYTGTEVLASRRRHRQFWIPSAAIGFGAYLARSIEKERLDDERTRRLSCLFEEDPAGCGQEIARWWGHPGTTMIVSCIKSGDWTPVRQQFATLRSELRIAAIRRAPLRFMTHTAEALAGRMRRLWRPAGLNVAFLGPDGAGKSTVIEAVGPILAPAFARWTCGGFAPSPLQAVLRRPQGPTNQPHGLPPRSVPVSLLRAAYWLAYYTLSYPKLRLTLARSTLILNHRDFVDILVDPRRYRYAGPPWLTRLIWRISSKPDLVILLDAPPEVLQARKQEVSFDETARQRLAYLSLVRSIPNGHIVDASQPFEKVVREVCDIILRHLTMRCAQRFSSSR